MLRIQTKNLTICHSTERDFPTNCCPAAFPMATDTLRLVSMTKTRLQIAENLSSLKSIGSNVTRPDSGRLGDYRRIKGHIKDSERMVEYILASVNAIHKLSWGL